MHAKGQHLKHPGSKVMLSIKDENYGGMDGCCEEGEWTSTKTKKVKLGREYGEGE